MIGSATLMAVASMKLIAEPRIAAVRTQRPFTLLR